MHTKTGSCNLLYVSSLGHGSVGPTAIAIAVVVLVVLCGAVSLVYWKRQMVSCEIVCLHVYMYAYNLYCIHVLNF